MYLIIKFKIKLSCKHESRAGISLLNLKQKNNSQKYNFLLHHFYETGFTKVSFDTNPQ